MRRDSNVFAPIRFLCVAAAIFLLSGCATAPPAKAPPGEPAGAPPHGKVQMPEEIEIALRLRPGQSWKSRFVSTSEVRHSLADAAGKGPSKSKSVGLELVSTQLVKEVTGKTARIEVNETSARILQEGRFVDAPFRQFNPPNPVTFTIDMETGKTDFTELEKAYGAWMESVKAGPAAEILGRSFRLEGYVAQLKELYGKPFNRFARKALSKEPREQAQKEFFIPFLGPGTAMGPVPVSVTMRQDGFEVKGGAHTLAVAGEFAGQAEMSPEEVGARLADLGEVTAKPSAATRTVTGSFRSSVDILSGRELQATSQVTYSATAAVDGKTFSEDVAAKLILEPAD